MPRLTHTIRTRFSRLKKRLWNDMEREQRRQAKQDMKYWKDNGMTPPNTDENFSKEPSPKTTAATAEKQAKKASGNESATKSFEKSIKKSTSYMKESLKKSTRTKLKTKLNTRLNTAIIKKQKTKGKQRATSSFDDLLEDGPLDYEVTDEGDIDARFCRTVHKSQFGEPLCENCARARHCARQIRRKSEDVATAAVEEHKDARRRSLGGGRTPVMEAMYRETFAQKTDDNATKKDTQKQAKQSFIPRAEEVEESSKTQQQQLDGPAENETGDQTSLGQELEALYADVLRRCNDLQKTSRSLTKSQRRLQRNFARMQAYTDDRIRRYMAYRFREISFPPTGSASTSTLNNSFTSSPSALSSSSRVTSTTRSSASTAPTSLSSPGSTPPTAQTLAKLHNNMALTATLLRDYEVLLTGDEDEDEDGELADVMRSVESVAAWMWQMCRYMDSYLANPPPREEDVRRMVEEGKRREVEEQKRREMEMEMEKKGKEGGKTKKKYDGGGVPGWELRRSLDAAEREFRAW
ncbi:hypothetical protein GE09DRAFT_1060352 [Coniochaeta sp. 2T2.1]|nr:hypothetical protein GE09DRAFT_1060352 [Coniochaeta sp. 2T2.1]